MTSTEKQRISRGSTRFDARDGGTSTSVENQENMPLRTLRTANLSPNHGKPDYSHMPCGFHLDMNHLSEVEGLAGVFLDLFGQNHLAIGVDCQPPRGQGWDERVSRESHEIQLVLQECLFAPCVRGRNWGEHYNSYTNQLRARLPKQLL